MVRYSISTLVTSAFCSVFLAAVLVAMPVVTEGLFSPWTYAALTALLLISLYMLLVCLRWRIRVENGELLITPVFGGKKTVRIIDITEVVSKGNVVIAYLGGKRLFTLDISSINADLLIKDLKNRGRMRG